MCTPHRVRIRKKHLRWSLNAELKCSKQQWFCLLLWHSNRQPYVASVADLNSVLWLYRCLQAKRWPMHNNRYYHHQSNHRLKIQLNFHLIHHWQSFEMLIFLLILYWFAARLLLYLRWQWRPTMTIYHFDEWLLLVAAVDGDRHSVLILMNSFRSSYCDCYCWCCYCYYLWLTDVLASIVNRVLMGIKNRRNKKKTILNSVFISLNILNGWSITVYVIWNYSMHEKSKLNE